MIVCCCFGTTDREIRRAFGPNGDRKCPAGQGCGSCMEMVRAIAARSEERAGGDGQQTQPRDARSRS